MCRISREPVTAVTARDINIDAEVYLDEQSPAGSRVRRAGLWGRVYLGAVDRRRHARRFGLAARIRRRARVLQPGRGRADPSGHRLGPGGEGPQFATGSPRPHAGEASRSLGAGRGQLCWPSPCTPDPSPGAGVAAATGHTPLVVGGHPSHGPPVSHHRGRAIRSSRASRASWEMVLPSRAATAAARSRRVAATRNAICGEVAVPDREGRPVARRTCSTMSSATSGVSRVHPPGADPPGPGRRPAAETGNAPQLGSVTGGCVMALAYFSSILAAL